MPAPMMAMIVVIIIVAAPPRPGVPLPRRRAGGCRAFGATLDDLVEFAAVEPNATAGRTPVDLDALAL